MSTNVGAGISGPDEQNVSQPLTGLGAGQGLLGQLLVDSSIGLLWAIEIAVSCLVLMLYRRSTARVIRVGGV